MIHEPHATLRDSDPDIGLFTVLRDGVSAFTQAQLTFPMTLTEEVLDPQGNRLREEMTKVTTIGYTKVLAAALTAELQARGIVPRRPPPRPQQPNPFPDSFVPDPPRK